MFSVQIEGAAELQRLLQQLPDRVQSHVLKDAMSEGAEVVVDACDASTRQLLGGDMGAAIANAFTYSIHRRRKIPGIEAIVYLKADPQFVGQTKAGNRYFIPAAIEYGHASPSRGARKVMFFKKAPPIRYGGGPKTTPPHPFFRPGWDRSKEKTLVVIINALREGIESVAAKAALKISKTAARAEAAAGRAMRRTARLEKKAARFLGL